MATEKANASMPAFIELMGQIEAAEGSSLYRIAAIGSVQMALNPATVNLDLGALEATHTGRVAGQGRGVLGAGRSSCVGQPHILGAVFVEGEAASQSRGGTQAEQQQGGSCHHY